jgi:hypothetical protein
MGWGDVRDVKLILSPKAGDSIKDLGRLIEDDHAVGEVDDRCMELASVMQAHLLGGGFEIEERPKDPTREVDPEVPTVWSWGLAANTKGSHNLLLNVRIDTSLNQTGEEFRSADPPIFDAYVNVKATLRQNVSDFAKSNWQWLWTAILVPVGIWLWGRYKGSDETEKEQEG